MAARKSKADPELLDDDLFSGFDEVFDDEEEERGKNRSAPPVNDERTQIVREEEPQKTQIINLPGALKPASLRVTAGKDAGQIVPLNKPIITIGRAAENDFVLKDLAASRKHLEIARDANGAMRAVDLGSGNGTFVNGLRIRQHNLRNGDEIKVGTTVMKFEDPNAGPSDGVERTALYTTPDEKTQTGAPPPPPMSGLKRAYAGPAPAADKGGPKKLILLGSVFLVAFFLVLGFIKAVILKPVKPPPETTQATQASEEAKKADAASQHVVEGIDLFKQRRWSEAITKFGIALALNSGDIKAAEYKVQAEKERDHEAILREAKRAADDKDFVLALRKLKTISSESTYRRDADDIRRTVLRDRFDEIDKLIDKGQGKKAAKICDDILDAEPDNEEAQKLKKKAESAKSSGGGGGGGGSKPTYTSSKPSGGGGGGGGGGGKPSSSAELAPAISLYKQGMITQAMQWLKQNPAGQSPGGQATLKRMQNFYSIYAQAQLFKKSNPQGAKKMFQQAQSVDKSIASDSKFSNDIKNHLASLK